MIYHPITICFTLLLFSNTITKINLGEEYGLFYFTGPIVLGHWVRNSRKILKQKPWWNAACWLAIRLLFIKLSHTPKATCLRNIFTHSGLALLHQLTVKIAPHPSHTHRSIWPGFRWRSYVNLIAEDWKHDISIRYPKTKFSVQRRCVCPRGTKGRE